MPRTASSQVQSRSNAKARPSANVRAGNLVANTPVLFRLPAIPTAPAQDLAVTFSEAAAALPTATLAAVALTTAQPAVTQSTAVQVEPTIEQSAATQPAPQQTWWEHWSSGIVLIVLLIALATASILAWQGSSKGNSKLMADTKQETDSQSDLSNIAIPKIESPKLDLPKPETPVSTKSNSYADKLESPSAQNDQQPSAFNAESSLVPNDSLSLTFDSPSKNEVKSEPELHATASLQTPVVKPQEPLFQDGELTPAKPNVNAQPASTPTQRNTTSSEKPNVWDSSKTNTRETSKPLTLEFSNDDSSSAPASNMSVAKPSSESSTSAQLISQGSEASSNIAAMTAETSTSGSLASGTLVPKDMPFAGKTATPEMDQSEYIALYRKLALTQAAAAPAKVDNRYELAAAAAAMQSQPGSSGTQASTVGYQQQLANQGNMQPASNNYTLQPNYAANSGIQQYQPATQSQTIPSQYANPQFQHSQFPSQPYSNQQYSGGQNPAVPQYANQSQTGMQNPNNMPGLGASNSSQPMQGLQYGGAQVPYTMPPSQPSGVQLPPGPIGGYGYSQPSSATSTGTQFGAPGVMPNNKPAGSTANLATPTSPNYPSLR